MSDPIRVVLVGLMGAGKSAVASRLAEQLGAQVIDTDDSVQSSSGSTIGELFEREGEASFRSLELDALRAALSSGSPVVIATGGGIVTTPAARELLTAHHPVVFLDVSVPVAATRVGDARSRPLLAGDPRARLAVLREERLGLYLEVADLVVDADAKGVAAVVGAILDGLGLAS